MKKEHIRYYETFEDDFHQSGIEYKLDDDYKWIRKDFVFKFLSNVAYALAIAFSSIYCKLFLHVRFVGREKLKSKNGCFVYGNHTQPVGDVFDPALACLPKHIYTLANPVNYALPIIGKLLPYLGALPIPQTLSGMKDFTKAVDERYKEGSAVVVYPEAHLWDYYTQIRPFPEASFRFPAKLSAPVFAMTATYQKHRLFKKPRITIYIDGPFYAEGSVKERTNQLHKSVYECMCERSRESNFEYIKYIKK